MYLARDKNNELYLFNEPPRRGSECWWSPSGLDGTYLRLDESLYPQISWQSESMLMEIMHVLPEK